MLTVGCDPEYLVINESGYKQNASDLSHTIEGAGEIGTDHGGRVGELRPKHGTPQQVTANIKKMFVWIKTHHPDKKIVAGGGIGFNESIGGHIHIGGLEFSGYTSVTRWRSRRRRGRYSTYGDNTDNPRSNVYDLASMDSKQKLVYALDLYLGRRLKRVTGGKRGSGSYGKYGDIETKSHGFEYRTPPSWLTDPILTEAVLAITMRIVELWTVKPTMFDLFIEMKKRSARKKDFNLLIGTGSGSKYMQRQVANYKRIIFSKSYKLDNRNLLENWTTVQQQPVVVEERTSTGRRGAKKVTQKIHLQICQLKLVEQENQSRRDAGNGAGFSAESVAKVIRFAIPEVKIYPLGDYPPWQFQLVKDLRLRPDTLYFSKEMRPFLKIKRGTIRTRFVELRRRTPNGQEPMENVVFYNNTRSELNMLEEVINIFELGARTKLRREVDSE